MPLPSRVLITEVGPRDGLQNEKQPVPTDVKVELCGRLLDAGVRQLEATSFVSPKWVPQMADAAEVMARLPRRAGVTLSVLTQSSEDLTVLLEMSAEEPDLLEEIEAELTGIKSTIDDLELRSALDGPHDASNALLVIHSGEGGVDAQDWAHMVARMYLKWGDKHGFKTDLLDQTAGEEAGIKNATIEIRGSRAYGYAKAEAGSHRLVRMSPFDAAHRRHTAVALVEVLPEI